MVELLRGVWRFRGFIAASVKREFVSRYLGTQLGFLWPIIHPLALILIYTLVFAGVMSPRLPGHESRFAYSVYLTAGLIVWILFSDLLTRSVGIFVQNANLLKKVNLHKLSLPAIASISTLVHALILLGLFVVFLVAAGMFPGIVAIAVIPVLALATFLAMAMGLFLATVNVFYRDVGHAANLVLQFWFWATPIVYPSSTLPEWARDVLALNPLWPITRAMQDIFVEARAPDWASLAYPLALGVVFMFLARATFERLANELVDEL